MSAQKFHNYLRTCRRKAGLSHRELAYLLGNATAGHISRYERRKRLPSVKTALGFQAALNTPVSELFAETYRSVSKEVCRRARNRASEIERERESIAKSKVVDSSASVLRSHSSGT